MDKNLCIKGVSMKPQNQQKELTGQKTSELSSTLEGAIDRKAFTRRQADIFDKAAVWFSGQDTLYSEAYKRLQAIVEKGISGFECTLPLRVLDVGAGCGVLTGILLDINPEMRITAVDLSYNMLFELKRRYPGVMTIHLDIVDLSGPTFFDMVWFNACFGNLYDPAAALRHVASQMSYGASLHISHPMGRAYQQRLHEQDPLTVPHLLPANKEEAMKLAEGSGLKLELFEDEDDSYLASYRLRS